MAYTLFRYPSPAVNDVIELPTSFEKVKVYITSGGTGINLRLEGVPDLTPTNYNHEIEVPRIAGHSPYTFKVLAAAGSIANVYFLIERTGGTPDANYWKIESVDPDGTIHYEEEG